MILSAEITMYPLQDNYLDPIKGVIAKLNSYSNIEVSTFATATVIMGEFDQVMEVLKDILQWSHATYGKAVFITKFLPDYQAL